MSKIKFNSEDLKKICSGLAVMSEASREVIENSNNLGGHVLTIYLAPSEQNADNYIACLGSTLGSEAAKGVLKKLSESYRDELFVDLSATRQ